MQADTACARGVVLDTNVVLDLLVFADPSVQPLGAALAGSRLVWLSLPAMREEFQRVLAYPRVAPHLAARGLNVASLLAAFDAGSRCCAAVPASPVRCTDPDDQMFIDLACAHAALLISKDRAVQAVRRALLAYDVEVLERFVTTAAGPSLPSASRSGSPAGTLTG